MATYTLLMADDEENVLNVIQKKVDWAAIGFEIVGTADNGAKAWEMIQALQPDVVLTDIRMPYMTGLEVIEQAKPAYPATKFVIFTGFDEFEYAKAAIHLEVGDYLLKPASAAELTKTFTALHAKMDQEFADSRNTEALQQYYQASLPLMQANFYASLIEGRIEASELPKYLTDYQISLQAPQYVCMVLHVSKTQVPAGFTPPLVAAAVRQHAEQYFSAWGCTYLTYLDDTVMFVPLKSAQTIETLTDLADQFCKFVQRKLQAVVTMGVGLVCTDILDLARSYTGARMAVSYRSVYGASRVINITEIAPEEVGAFSPVNDAALAELFKQIHVGSTEAIATAVDHYLAHLDQTAATRQQHMVVTSELIGALYRFAVNNHLQVEPLSGDLKALYAWLPDLSPQSLRQWLLVVSANLSKQLTKARDTGAQTVVAQAQDYVRHHYSEAGWGLDEVCASLGVSKAYFSTLFKRKTGQSFVSYLTDYRMDWAARLLQETNDKSHVIGTLVGYVDANYFSYVFKRKFGLSPQKYRTQAVTHV